MCCCDSYEISCADPLDLSPLASSGIHCKPGYMEPTYHLCRAGQYWRDGWRSIWRRNGRFFGRLSQQIVSLPYVAFGVLAIIVITLVDLVLTLYPNLRRKRDVPIAPTSDDSLLVKDEVAHA